MLIICKICGKETPIYGQSVKTLPDGEEVTGWCSSCRGGIKVYIPFEKPAPPAPKAMPQMVMVERPAIVMEAPTILESVTTFASAEVDEPFPPFPEGEELKPKRKPKIKAEPPKVEDKKPVKKAKRKK